ncbi:MAG: tRNA (adenosine(37)-N6)-threonylcarbamoyltransferase complex dimerization subunit type 1 TsaB [Candidatus Adiutrix sp.]|jgi:tRNA threonylcarbamoyladenosine biosynthesis protein TsaB|nr:tRNA (adenosine(37)-N6)-threonylcarbamoyltransferase complex dimerization subunit type 1 TsaB [Candidatus Adiutrix sp.]
MINKNTLPLTILAWDTAGPQCCLALVRFADGAPVIVDEFVSEAGGLHSQTLPPQVAAMLERAGLRPGNLSLLAVGRGPGSFTGLRTGLAMAKGLAMGSNVPLMGVSTLDILAALMLEGQAPGALAAPLIDARHREVYAALYQAVEGRDGCPTPERLMEPEPLSPEAVGGRLAEIAAGRRVTVGGPGFSAVREGCRAWPESVDIGPEDVVPSAVMLARLAAARFWESPAAVELNPPLPMYIRPPDIRTSGIVV